MLRKRIVSLVMIVTFIFTLVTQTAMAYEGHDYAIMISYDYTISNYAESFHDGIAPRFGMPWVTIRETNMTLGPGVPINVVTVPRGIIVVEVGMPVTLACGSVVRYVEILGAPGFIGWVEARDLIRHFW